MLSFAVVAVPGYEVIEHQRPRVLIRIGLDALINLRVPLIWPLEIHLNGDAWRTFRGGEILAEAQGPESLISVKLPKSIVQARRPPTGSVFSARFRRTVLNWKYIVCFEIGHANIAVVRSPLGGVWRHRRPGAETHCARRREAVAWIGGHGGRPNRRSGPMERWGDERRGDANRNRRRPSSWPHHTRTKVMFCENRHRFWEACS
jgi:hypothetical protein